MSNNKYIYGQCSCGGTDGFCCDPPEYDSPASPPQPDYDSARYHRSGDGWLIDRQNFGRGRTGGGHDFGDGGGYSRSTRDPNGGDRIVNGHSIRDWMAAGDKF